MAILLALIVALTPGWFPHSTAPHHSAPVVHPLDTVGGMGGG